MYLFIFWTSVNRTFVKITHIKKLKRIRFKQVASWYGKSILVHFRKQSKTKQIYIVRKHFFFKNKIKKWRKKKNDKHFIKIFDNEYHFLDRAWLPFLRTWSHSPFIMLLLYLLVHSCCPYLQSWYLIFYSNLYIV